MTLIPQPLQSLLFLTQWDPVNKVAHPHSGPFASACQSIPSHPPFPLRPRKAGHLEVTPWAVSDRYKGKPLPAKDATWYQRGLDLPVHHDGLLLPAAADLCAPPGSHHEWHLALLLWLRPILTNACQWPLSLPWLTWSHNISSQGDTGTELWLKEITVIYFILGESLLS